MADLCSSAKKVEKQWKGSAVKLRLGQYFINKYTPKDINPELFYEENAIKALLAINQWLIDHQYTDTLPQH